MLTETQQASTELMLHCLPDDHREILIATYFRGRTTREAARELGIAPAVAAGRLHQAMRALALMLAVYGPQPADRDRYAESVPLTRRRRRDRAAGSAPARCGAAPPPARTPPAPRWAGPA